MCKNHDHNHSKVSKFGDFILESKTAKLLLEGNLMASDKFVKKLSDIKDNPIANSLYQAFSDRRHIDKDLSQNWVDVSDKDDVVTFMADRGAARLNDDPDVVFSTKGRNEIKVGRFARAILTELGQKVTDKDIEIFVNTYKASKEDVSKRFEMVSGPIIKKYYLGTNYASGRGTLGDSCMKGEDCQDYFKIYTKNPEVCQLLVYLNEEGKVIGRALVWKLSSKELYSVGTQMLSTGSKKQDQVECPAEYFMDRVYTNNDSDVIKFVNYAKEKGWLYKWKMTADDQEGLIFKYNDSLLFGRIIVRASRCVFRKYPFVDSLNFCDGDSYISNVGFAVDEDDDDSEEGFIMQDTDGGSDPCSNCDGSGYDDDNSTDCKKCDGNGEVDCPDCRGDGREICKKCDGDGDIECKACDGRGDYDCTVCGGDGDMECKKCHGDGFFKCKVCDGDGIMGECKRCKGNCEIECKTCKGEPLTCKTCLGSCKVTKKWGRGTRVVSCPDCNGEGKATAGDKNQEGCRCPECSQNSWSGDWRNTGEVSCPDCNGEGNILCKSCKDKEGRFDMGDIECDDCGGSGTNDCTNSDCSHGNIHCNKCDGRGNTGKCDNCGGSGHLGKCKNPDCGAGDCDDGRMKCRSCKGSGDRPKDAGKQLCSDCAGLLDVMKEDLKSGDYKVR